MTQHTLNFTFLFSLVFYSTFFSQNGCTDPAANNFNSAALNNDGSCTYNPAVQSFQSKGSLASYANESSGLVYTDGYIWTHNDSGNPAKIFKMDSANGTLLQTISITNFPNNDWEDITADSNFIYIGDFGNNNGTRTDLKILKLDKAQFANNTAAVVNATVQAISFSYADQTNFTSNSNTNFDCESVISIGSFLYLFTKNRGDYETRVYKVSKSPGTYTLNPITSFNVNGKITGADYNPQKKEIALIGYMSSDKNSFIWFLNDFNSDQFFSGNKRRVEIGNSINGWQTEGITYASNNELFLSCETSYTPASLYTTYKSSLSPVGLEKLKKESSEIKLFPNPFSTGFEIDSDEIITQVEIIYPDGTIIYSKRPDTAHCIISNSDFNVYTNTFFFVNIRTNTHSYVKKLVRSDY